jgi:O-antigen ligase
MMRERIMAGVQYASILAVMFLLPFKAKILAPILGVFCISTLLTRGFFSSLRSLPGSPVAGAMLLFYFLHVAGLLWSDNIKFGLFDLQIKLSLLIAPVFFYTTLSIGNVGRSALLRLYSIGVIAAFLVCVIRAASWNEAPYPFTYREFSWFMHPGYFSMHLCMALGIFTENLINRKLIDSVFWFYLFCVIMMLTGMVLLSSKAGFIVGFMILIIQLMRWLRMYPDKKNLTYIVLIALAVMASLQIRDSKLSERFGQLLEAAGSESVSSEYNSTTIRITAWRASWDLIKSAPLQGYGTGDIKDVLVEYYGDHKLVELEDQGINPHNQFFQTWLALGITGLVLLCIIIFSIFRIAFMRNDMTALFLGMILFINMLVESVIEVEAGVMFFAVFAILLSSQRYDVNQT